MTQTQSDRLKDVQRQYAEMEHHTATLQQAAWVAENNYNSLTDKCREEFRVRQQVLVDGVEIRAAPAPEYGGDRGGYRRAGGGVDDSSRQVAVGYLPRRPQQRLGYAGRVVELVVKGGVASNTVAKSSDSRPAIVTRPRAMAA